MKKGMVPLYPYPERLGLYIPLMWDVDGGAIGYQTSGETLGFCIVPPIPVLDGWYEHNTLQGCAWGKYDLTRDGDKLWIVDTPEIENGAYGILEFLIYTLLDDMSPVTMTASGSLPPKVRFMLSRFLDERFSPEFLFANLQTMTDRWWIQTNNLADADLFAGNLLATQQFVAKRFGLPIPYLD